MRKLLILMALLTTVGCCTPQRCNSCRRGLCPVQFENLYCRYLDEFQAGWHARMLARKQLSCMRKNGLSCDYRYGFEAAFVDVSHGSRGGIPPQPPAAYWNTCTRSPSGHARVEQWYAGYSAGLESALAQREQFNRVPSRDQSLNDQTGGFPGNLELTPVSGETLLQPPASQGLYPVQ